MSIPHGKLGRLDASMPWPEGTVHSPSAPQLYIPGSAKGNFSDVLAAIWWGIPNIPISL